MSKISENAYQILMEGTADVIIKVSETESYNYSTLIRDLYSKVYTLKHQLAELSESIPKQAIPSQEIPTNASPTQGAAAQ